MSTLYAKIIAALVLVGILLSSVCCTESTNSGFRIESSSPSFKIVTIQKGFARFSFEYPAFYKEMIQPGVDDFIIADASVGRRLPGNYPAGYRYDILLGVQAQQASKDVPDAESLLRAYQIPGLEDYEVIERSRLTIGADTGELIVWSFTAYLWDGTPEPMIVRSVFFNHKRLIFYVAAWSDKDAEETARADFEHILKTFKILD